MNAASMLLYTAEDSVHSGLLHSGLADRSGLPRSGLPRSGLSGLADRASRSVEFGKHAGRADSRFWNPRYHAPVSTNIATILALVASSVLLLCASDAASSASTASLGSASMASTASTDSTDSEPRETKHVVLFTELLTRTIALAPHVQNERATAKRQEETDTYAMPEVTAHDDAEPELPKFEYLALIANHPKPKMVEYRVMCCLVAVYAAMVAGTGSDHAGLFGLLASDICRALLVATHPPGHDTEIDPHVVAMHWYLRGNHDIYTAARVQNTNMAIGATDDDDDGEAYKDKGRREVEALVFNSKSMLDAAFSIVA